MAKKPKRTFLGDLGTLDNIIKTSKGNIKNNVAKPAKSAGKSAVSANVQAGKAGLGKLGKAHAQSYEYVTGKKAPSGVKNYLGQPINLKSSSTTGKKGAKGAKDAKGAKGSYAGTGGYRPSQEVIATAINKITKAKTTNTPVKVKLDTRPGAATAGVQLSSAAAAGASLTPEQKKAIRLEKKYGADAVAASKKGKGGKSGKAAPPPPDEIADQIAAQIQASGRYTDFYNKQTKMIQDETVANSNAVAAATNGMSTIAPTIYTGQPGQMSADQYATSLMGAASAGTNADIKSAATRIGGTGAALNAYYGSARDLANSQHKNLSTQIKQSEPKLRAAKAAAEQEAAMKQAEQDYLMSKLNVDAQYKSGQLALGQSRLNETVRNNTQTSADRNSAIGAANQRAVLAAETQAASTGAKMGQAAQKRLDDWVKKNLYVNQTSTVKNPDGSGSTSVSQPTRAAGLKFEDVFQMALRDGATDSKDAALRVAIAHDPKGAKALGARTLYLRLVRRYGVSKRQSLKYLQLAGFPKGTVNNAKKNGQKWIEIDDAAKKIIGG